MKGTCCFFGGIVVLLLGWPVLGMILEVYGFVALFGGFMPMVGWLSLVLKLKTEDLDAHFNGYILVVVASCDPIFCRP